MLARKYADIHGNPMVFMHHELEAPPPFRGSVHDWKREHERMNQQDYGHPQGEPAPPLVEFALWAWLVGGTAAISWLVLWLLNHG